MTKFRNLVFEGGGTSGVCYAGAIQELEKIEQQNENIFSFKDIQRTGGASVGAITALLVSLKYTGEEITSHLKNLDFTQFEDDDVGIIRDLYRLYEHFGFYKGEALFNVIKSFINEKTGSEKTTFGDLKEMGFRDLYVVVTKAYKLNGQLVSEACTFSAENAFHTEVAPVVLASASIEGFFQCVRLLKTTEDSYEVNDEGHVFADGGMYSNFPITLFDSADYYTPPLREAKETECDKAIYNPETLGIRIDDALEISDLRDKAEAKEEVIPKGDFVNYLVALVNGATSGRQDDAFRKSHNRDRSIFIDRKGTKATDFSLSSEKKDELIAAGKLAVSDFFKQKENVIVPNEEVFVEPQSSVMRRSFLSFFKVCGDSQNVIAPSAQIQNNTI
ncbi:MAG: patatin-like phospholipase family protein [Gammaproteobacteria bacterium]|nr:patatin-like phospholipase family protein [Gammaproteobacteria bacterium]